MFALSKRFPLQKILHFQKIVFWSYILSKCFKKQRFLTILMKRPPHMKIVSGPFTAPLRESQKSGFLNLGSESKNINFCDYLRDPETAPQMLLGPK